MGNTNGMPLQHSQENPVGGSPAQVVLSDKFGDIGLPEDFELFAEEMWKVAKKPGDPNFFRYEKYCKPDACKETVTDDGTVIFEMSYVLDGEKWKQVDPTADGLDYVTVDQVVKFDKANRKLTSNIYNAPRKAELERTPNFTTNTHFLDPLQIMYYWTLPDGTTVAGEVVMQTLQPYVDAIARRIKERKVKLRFDEEAKVVQPVGPIDEITDYDRFFDAYVKLLKKPQEIPNVENSNVSEEESGNTTTVTWDAKGPQQSWKGSVKVTADKTKGSIMLENTLPIRFLKITEITKDPLTYMTWTEGIAGDPEEGKKTTSEFVWDGEQEFVEDVVKEATSWGFW